MSEEERQVREMLIAHAPVPVESARMRSRMTDYEIAAKSVQLFRLTVEYGGGAPARRGLCGAGYVASDATTVSAAQSHVRRWRWRMLAGVALDGPRTRGTAQRSSGSVAADKVKDLRGIVRIWTRLTHRPSDDSSSGATVQGSRLNDFRIVAQSRGKLFKPRQSGGLGLLLIGLAACGPKAHIPLRPPDVPGLLAPSDSGALLARSLAPVLYLQRDETFPLSRSVAVLHPRKRIIAYHLLWRDDVNGSWIPFTVPTDQEIVWVGYDSTFAPSEVWTYWHGAFLHTKWPKLQVGIDVQWGKHGSLPRGIRESDLPRMRTLNFFYAATIFLLPDILLGDLTRKGPFGFFHSYRRYRDFSRQLVLADRLDAVIRAEDPDKALSAVFGKYSHKPAWPPGI